MDTKSMTNDELAESFRSAKRGAWIASQALNARETGRYLEAQDALYAEIMRRHVSTGVWVLDGGAAR